MPAHEPDMAQTEIFEKIPQKPLLYENLSSVQYYNSSIAPEPGRGKRTGADFSADSLITDPKGVESIFRLLLGLTSKIH